MTATSACHLQQWCILQTGHSGGCSEVPVKASAPEALASAISALASAYRRLLLARAAWRTPADLSTPEARSLNLDVYVESIRAEQALDEAVKALLVVAGVDR